MQEIIDQLTSQVVMQREEIEVYKKLIERKNKKLTAASNAIKDILDDEIKFKEYWF